MIDLDNAQLMKLRRATEQIKKLYLWALNNDEIEKPLAWAVYQTWKKLDGKGQYEKRDY